LLDRRPTYIFSVVVVVVVLLVGALTLVVELVLVEAGLAILCTPIIPLRVVVVVRLVVVGAGAVLVVVIFDELVLLVWAVLVVGVVWA
jgi:hypothetical protein